MAAALSHARTLGAHRIVVATARAVRGAGRSYRRAGFRMAHVERDAFTVTAGYPADLAVDGIPVRDRLWLDLALD